MAKTNILPEEREMLRGIYTGHDTICDLNDFLGKITMDTMLMFDRLEILGYVERCSTWYVDYLKFKLTNKGREALPEMTEEEKVLANEFGLSKEDYITLKEAKRLGTKDNNAFNISDNTGLKTMVLVTCTDNLEKKGYVKMTGIFRRYLQVTLKGEEVLKKIG